MTSDGPRSQVEKLWIAGGALVVLIVAALAWFVVVNPKLGDARDADARTEQAQTANAVLNARVQRLRTKSDAQAAIQQALRSVREALPTSAAVDVFTSQLSEDAQRAGVTITSIVASPPVPVVGTGTPTAGTSPSGQGVAGSGVAGRLFSVHVALVSDGPSAAQQTFLRSVQDGARVALVTSVSVAPSSTSQANSPVHRSTMTVELEVFVAPQSPEAEEALQRQLSAGGG